jgi:proteasome lid subunit RPN8/RPN11
MIEMNSKTLSNFRAHVKTEYPKEACGFVLEVQGSEEYYPATNISEYPMESFVIDPKSYAEAEDLGVIKAICHSHPNASSAPSEIDTSSCEASNKVWHIISWPEDKLSTLRPRGWVVPLVGRNFEYGVFDCCTLIRDYFKEKLNIEFECLGGKDTWWDRGENRYLDNYEGQGFRSLPIGSPVQEHDVFLMNIVSPVPNHAAVFTEGDIILHHLYGRLSGHGVYGGYWRKHTTHHLRHVSLC